MAEPSAHRVATSKRRLLSQPRPRANTSPDGKKLMMLESSLAPLIEVADRSAPAAIKPYSRTLIVGDREVPPCRLTGNKRKVFFAIYCTIVLTAVAGLAYSFQFNPWFALTALALGYYFENIAFACGHVGFHAEFIETPEPQMKTLWHHAFIHHYRNVHVFHETWLETRISYFIDPRASFTVKSGLKFLAIGLIFFPLAYFVDPALAVTIYAAQAIPALMQSTVHEWYHNPPANRKAFYGFATYWFYTTLERLGLASTKGHAIHHRHGLNNLNQVDRWLDLYIPFGESLGTYVWRTALSLYEPGKSHMTQFTRRGLPFKVFVGSHVATTALIVVAYYSIAR